MTFAELRAVFQRYKTGIGMRLHEKEDLLTLGRFFPLLVDLAEAQAGATFTPIPVRNPLNALLGAMSPAEPCPVCGVSWRHTDFAPQCQVQFTGYRCSRPQGHFDDHCAHAINTDGRRLVSWPQGPVKQRWPYCPIHDAETIKINSGIQRCICPSARWSRS